MQSSEFQERLESADSEIADDGFSRLTGSFITAYDKQHPLQAIDSKATES
jgi:hypothetical protein